MTQYTCRFLSPAGRIDDVMKFDCATDGLAQLHASRLLAKSEFAAIELWETGRLVFRDEKES